MTEMTATDTLPARVEIPSKWDVIPIHNSDRGTFKSCRRRWDWSSPARHNLTVRADVGGVYQPFFLGTGIHYGLENYYDPILQRDPVEAFKTWFSIVWDGGTVTADWLDKSYDLNPTYHAQRDLYEVRGLKEILHEVDEYTFLELRDLGVAMLENYKRYAKIHDGFEVIAVEHDFSVPIWDYENDRILTAIDMREESPNYGKMLEVHSRGRMDLQYMKPNEKLGIMDHKTAEKMDGELDVKLESDEQITTYLWAAEIEAQYYNLPWKGKIFEECIYNVLRKAAPKPPTIVRGGLFSVDRNNESATYEMIEDFMKLTDLKFSDLSEKHQEYVLWLREVGDEQFFVRKMVRRNRHQLKNFGERIYLEALDMLDPEIRIYPNLRKDWSCINCAFRPPCIAKEAGEDWEYLIHENYAQTKDR